MDYLVHFLQLFTLVDIGKDSKALIDIKHETF
jgi:hypothetical protein